MEAEMNKWEDRVKLLKKEFNEEFSDIVMIGIITSILPQSVQEFVYTTVSDQEETYGRFAAKIRSVVSNKVDMMAGPTPMDIGLVNEVVQKNDYDFGNYFDIDAVRPDTQCYACHEFGHMASNCPSNGNKGKGKGKGGKAYVFERKGGMGKGGAGGGTGFKGMGTGSGKGAKGNGGIRVCAGSATEWDAKHGRLKSAGIKMRTSMQKRWTAAESGWWPMSKRLRLQGAKILAEAVV